MVTEEVLGKHEMLGGEGLQWICIPYRGELQCSLYLHVKETRIYSGRWATWLKYSSELHYQVQQLLLESLSVILFLRQSFNLIVLHQ